MTVAVGCPQRPATPQVVVQLLDHPKFHQVRPVRRAEEPMTINSITARSHQGSGKTKHVSPLVLIGIGALYLAILGDLYLRFLS